MKKIYCDICGKKIISPSQAYEGYNPIFDDATAFSLPYINHVSGPSYITGGVATLDYRSKELIVSKDYDICPECAKKIYRYLNYELPLSIDKGDGEKDDIGVKDRG